MSCAACRLQHPPDTTTNPRFAMNNHPRYNDKPEIRYEWTNFAMNKHSATNPTSCLCSMPPSTPPPDTTTKTRVWVDDKVLTTKFWANTTRSSMAQIQKQMDKMQTLWENTNSAANPMSCLCSCAPCRHQHPFPPEIQQQNSDEPTIQTYTQRTRKVAPCSRDTMTKIVKILTPPLYRDRRATSD